MHCLPCRYELQEKRVMLSELKQELEYCKDTWEAARRKNNESETEWKKLRREFAARKLKDYVQSDLNDSGESGFSDEQTESGEEPENFDADRSNTQSPIATQLSTTIASASSADQNSARHVRDDNDEVLRTVPDAQQESLSESNPEPIPAQEAEANAVEEQELEPFQKQEPTAVLNQESAGILVQDLREQIQEEEEQEEEEEAETFVQREQKCLAQSKSSEKEASKQANPNPCDSSKVEDPSCARASNESSTDSTPSTTSERTRQTRENRLRRLEDQCQLLFRKVDITKFKSNFLSNRLEELHQQYGSDQAEDGNEAGTSDSGVSHSAPDGSEEPVNICRAALSQIEETAIRLGEFENIEARMQSAVTTSEGVRRREINCDRTHEEKKEDGENKIESTQVLAQASRSNDTEDIEREKRRESRAERLQRLEEECKSLVGRVSKTVRRSNDLVEKLDEIHEDYVNYEQSKPSHPQHKPGTEENEQGNPSREATSAIQEDHSSAPEESCKDVNVEQAVGASNANVPFIGSSQEEIRQEETRQEETRQEETRQENVQIDE